MRTLLEMQWRDCCFAHWRADPDRVARYLPDGVTLERYAGEAWLSVVPFRLGQVHVPFTPVLPGFGTVAEINLRTYVRVGSQRGIWFFSLDADSRALVESARLTTSLPYFHARIGTSESAGMIQYTSARSDGRAAPGTFAARYRVPAKEVPTQPETLVAFLHERYRFFTRRGSRLVMGDVRHAPWTLGATELEITENTLGELIAHPLHGAPDLAFFARHQTVRASAVRRVTVRQA